MRVRTFLFENNIYKEIDGNLTLQYSGHPRKQEVECDTVRKTGCDVM